MSDSAGLPRAAVIMAGGVGERFWPLSRRKFPKQLLPIVDGESLLEQARRRVAPLVPEGHVFVVTTAALAEPILEHAPAFKPENLILEPMARNTAACLALSLAAIEQRIGPAVMAVTTADHQIGDDERFRQILARGFDLAAANDALIVFGVKPTRPETGYGYIELGDVRHADADLPCHQVAKFHEKPGLERARAYMASGRHLWNSGMFIWRTDSLRAAYEKHAAPHAQGLREMAAVDVMSGREREALRAIFARMPNLSIDFAVLEHAENVWAIPTDFPWRDIGGWESVRELMTLDADGNAHQGETLALETRGSTLHSTGPVIATLGVEDLIVVATPDAVLVCPRDRAQEIKKIVGALADHAQEKVL